MLNDPHDGVWTTHNDEVAEELKAIEKRLVELLPASGAGADSTLPPNVTTDDGARVVVRNARRGLMLTLLAQETHEHWLDDCGDDLVHATETWAKLFDAWWSNDGEGSIEFVNAALNELRAEWEA